MPRDLWKREADRKKYGSGKRGKSEEPSGPLCPRCGAYMVKRVSRKDGKPFLGCSEYPICNGTESLPS